jgi:hypothetical protein
MASDLLAAAAMRLASMGASTLLSAEELAVEPGGETVCEVRIENTGDLVDQFTIDVVGPAHAWADVEPALVNLLPGDEETVRVTFRPPRSSDVAAGAVPFALRVRSREDPNGSRVDEGHVQIAPFDELVAELVPTTAYGRRKAKFRLAVDNLGNREVTAEISPIPPEDDCDLRVAVRQVTIAPGAAGFIGVRAIPHRRFFRGDPREHAFQVAVQPLDADQAEHDLTVDGTMVQERLIPKAVFTGLLIAIAAVAALIALWFTVFKPTVESAARGSAKAEVANASSAAARADEAAADAEEAAQDANAAAGQPTSAGAAGGANGSGADPNNPDGANGAGGAAGSGAPTSFRIETGARPVTDGSYQSFTFTAPDGQGLDIVDLVLQNPRGDTGFMRVALGDNVVLEIGLANFRDLDYHYSVPLELSPEQPLRILVSCGKPGAGATQCTPSASISGRLLKP